MLGEAVRDPEAEVRTAALRALHDVGDAMPFVPPAPVGAALEDPSPKVRYWAAGALGHARRGIDPFVPALLRHAEHDEDGEVRAVCAFELQDYIGPPGVTPSVLPLVASALDSPERDIRSAACAVLGRFGAAADFATPSIIRLLGHEAGKRAAPDDGLGPEQLSWAATALGKIAPGTPFAGGAATALVEALEVEANPVVTIAIIEALAPFGRLAHRAIPRLHERERDPNQVVREKAQKALAAIASSR
jgi:HEAT repeat protein